jgi:arylsulfatase
VLVIRFDDVGCSNFRRCGWAIRTPFIDTLANRGLRYSGLHTRAICSTGKRGSQLG